MTAFSTVDVIDWFNQFKTKWERRKGAAILVSQAFQGVQKGRGAQIGSWPTGGQCASSFNYIYIYILGQFKIFLKIPTCRDICYIMNVTIFIFITNQSCVTMWNLGILFSFLFLAQKWLMTCNILFFNLSSEKRKL